MLHKKSFQLRALFTIAAFAVVSMLASCQTQENIEQAVKSYLEKNPQIIQAEVDKALKAKGIRGQAPQKSIEDMIKSPIKVGLNNAPTMGPADAEITIVEFSDFQCPFCKRVTPTMEQLVKDYNGKVRVAFRQHPLSFHKNAMSAAKASLAANAQGKFWEMHDALFENQRDLSDENIKKLAKELGLNMKQFEADWKSNKFDAQIEEDIKFARANGATGTPAFFVNGVYVKGARPIAYFKEVITKLQEAKKGS
ncbi:MAG: thioredoxin domain-containing protein [Kiloniellales bacterium]|nr:thioredoxin domain-containing protein [Kiloniellales bacterium]